GFRPARGPPGARRLRPSRRECGCCGRVAMEQRQQRKRDHVRLAAAWHVRQPRPGAGSGAGWEDVHLVNHSLPELALEEIDLSTSIAGARLSRPVLINAMTGGAAELTAVNRDLAAVAAELGLAMAVGSQTAGLKSPEV